MQTVTNRTTGKVHLPSDGDALTLCGANLVRDGKENARFGDDAWLDDFPEDFGKSSRDCDTCASLMEVRP